MKKENKGGEEEEMCEVEGGRKAWGKKRDEERWKC